MEKRNLVYILVLLILILGFYGFENYVFSAAVQAPGSTSSQTNVCGSFNRSVEVGGNNDYRIGIKTKTNMMQDLGSQCALLQNTQNQYSCFVKEFYNKKLCCRDQDCTTDYICENDGVYRGFCKPVCEPPEIMKCSVDANNKFIVELSINDKADNYSLDYCEIGYNWEFEEKCISLDYNNVLGNNKLAISNIEKTYSVRVRIKDSIDDNLTDRSCHSPSEWSRPFKCIYYTPTPTNTPTPTPTITPIPTIPHVQSDELETIRDHTSLIFSSQSPGVGETFTVTISGLVDYDEKEIYFYAPIGVGRGDGKICTLDSGSCSVEITVSQNHIDYGIAVAIDYNEDEYTLGEVITFVTFVNGELDCDEDQICYF